jgi:hypothetical protein
MPTHALGPGTVNLTLNIPRGSRVVLGRLAFARGLSTGALVRRLIARGLDAEDRTAAEQWREIHRAARGVLVLAVGLLSIAQSFNPSSRTEPVRRARTLRVCRLEAFE